MDEDAQLSPLERDVLDEYATLVGNLDTVSPLAIPPPCIGHSSGKSILLPSADLFQLSNTLSDLASRPSAEILDALRALERRTAAVFTLLKASVYSIVLQQEIYGEDEDAN